MKFVALIMAFTVLALSMVPCMDATSAISTQKKGISLTSQQHEHNDKDGCSPFCTCSCCSVSIISQVAFYALLPKLSFQVKKYPGFHPSFYANVSLSIWQPPKIA